MGTNAEGGDRSEWPQKVAEIAKRGGSVFWSYPPFCDPFSDLKFGFGRERYSPPEGGTPTRVAGEWVGVLALAGGWNTDRLKAGLQHRAEECLLRFFSAQLLRKFKCGG
jgi:hypothetical protein